MRQQPSHGSVQTWSANHCHLACFVAFVHFNRHISTVWIYQTRGWVFVALDPALFSTPVAMNNMALSGLDMRRLNWTAVDMSYYNSSDYLVDVRSGSSKGERKERGYVLSGRGF